MREIRFRAWDVDKKKMISLRPMDSMISQGSHLCFGVEEFGHTYWSEQDLQGLKFELMQYTGLTDKNGKEIYEGDIIRADTSGVGQVVFDMAEFAIDFPSYESHHLYCYKSKEVIGNIHENPELLNKDVTET